MTRSHRNHVWNNDSRHRRASPVAPEYRPGIEPYAGPVGDEAMRAQLLEDPEFLEWQAEERAGELAAMTRRVYR